MEDKQEIFAKSVALTLLDDEPIGERFISDIELNYLAPEIVYLFQNLSHLLYDVVVTAVAAFIVYKACQQHEGNRLREELISRFEAILKENRKQIKQCFKNLENRIDKFDTKYERITREMIEERKRDGKSEVVARREIEHEIISERKRRLSALSEKAKRFKPSTKNAELLAEIMEKEYTKVYSAQKSHVNQFR